MTVTRVAIETVLVSRTRKRMDFVGMSVVPDGHNADLNDPISTALQRMGITPADITQIQDSDLATVEDVSQLLDLAELRLLENIYGNSDAVDIDALDRSEKYSQFTTALEKAIARKTEQINTTYGMGLGTLSAGVIDLDFQAKGDDAEIT
jgi:hypothetical protein